jgi:hypothetical protein
MFFLMGAFFIISEKDLKMTEKGNFATFSSLYFSWLGQIFDNSKVLTGYVVRMDWLPDFMNKTG